MWRADGVLPGGDKGGEGEWNGDRIECSCGGVASLRRGGARLLADKIQDTRYAISRQTLMEKGWAMGRAMGRPLYYCNSELGCCAPLFIGTSAQLVSSFGSLIFLVLLPVWGDVRIGSHA